MSFEKSKASNEMSLEKNGESNEKNVKKNGETNGENRYVKNSIDYSSNECSHVESDDGNKSLIDFEENDLNELALLEFFNDFTLIDIGIHDLIREVYFED